MTIREYIDHLIQNPGPVSSGRMTQKAYEALIARLRKEQAIYGYTIVPDMPAIDGQMIRVEPHIETSGINSSDIPDHWHRHDCYEMVYVYDGTFTNIIRNEGSMTLERGDILIMNRNTQHAICSAKDHSVAFNILISTRLFSQGGMSLLHDNPMFRYFFTSDIYSKSTQPLYLHFHTDNHPGVSALAERVILESINDYSGREGMIQAATIMIFAELCRVPLETDLSPRGSTLDPRYCDIVEYMAAHCSTVTLRDLSEHFHYSEAYMSKLFVRIANRHFRDVLRDIRLDRAAGLLEHTTQSPEEIGYATGFRDVTNFQNLFKKRFGSTPKVWRQRIHTEKDPY